MKIIIVGGVAAGAACACRLRRLMESADITIYEKGKYISFANCGLPYHIGGIIKEKSALLVQTPQKIKNRFNIEVNINMEVINIDRTNKKIKVKNLHTNEIKEDTYDKLVLATGAVAGLPPIKGIDNPKVFPLKTIPDMENILNTIKSGARTCVVIGGGFIGIEAAENLKEAGLEVTLIEMLPQVLTFLDKDMAYFAQKELINNKINLLLNEGVTKITQNHNGKLILSLKSEKKIETDFIVLATGVKPDNILARKAGLEIGKTGGIKVNEKMQTSDPDIYAAGDVVEVKHFITNREILMPLAGPAAKQGRVIANNIAGIQSVYKNPQGTSIIKIFNIACASTGANKKELIKANIPFKTITIHPYNHASYYPGANRLHLKLLFCPDSGKLYGAQCVGKTDVAKRIDVLATAIRHGATVHDLEYLDLAYAPPFGNAKDPVNMAGFVATNLLHSLIQVIEIEDLKDELAKENVFVLDVRTNSEYRRGSIPRAVNIPVDSLRTHINEIPPNKTIIIYCREGVRSYIAQRILLQNGFKNILNLSGGYTSYKNFYE